MYIYIYVYISIYKYIYTHICIYIYIYISVAVMKCGTRGAREVGLDCSDGTDLLLCIRWDGQGGSEDWKPESFRTEVLKNKLAGLRVTVKGAADELRTVGRTGPSGDTPQGPGLECKLAKGELIVVRSRQPVLDCFH